MLNKCSLLQNSLQNPTAVAKRALYSWRSEGMGLLFLLGLLVAIIALIVWLPQQWWFWVAVGIIVLGVISWKWPEKNP